MVTRVPLLQELLGRLPENLIQVLLLLLETLFDLRVELLKNLLLDRLMIHVHFARVFGFDQISDEIEAHVPLALLHGL
jgi:hypothetical protein